MYHQATHRATNVLHRARNVADEFALGLLAEAIALGCRPDTFKGGEVPRLLTEVTAAWWRDLLGLSR
jgi:hypothetical protein